MVIYGSVKGLFNHLRQVHSLFQFFFHGVQSSASSSKFLYPIFSWTLSSSCLRLHPRLPITSVLPSIFPSVTCFIRQFLWKMWPIRLASWCILDP
jgi:hypothetical protein